MSVVYYTSTMPGRNYNGRGDLTTPLEWWNQPLQHHQTTILHAISYVLPVIRSYTQQYKIDTVTY